MFHAPVHATKAYGREEVYFHSFLTTTLDAGEYLPAPSSSTVGKSPQYHQSRGIARWNQFGIIFLFKLSTV